MEQSTTISGEKSVTEKHGWKHTQGVKVTVEGKVGIPFISDFKVTVEGSAELSRTARPPPSASSPGSSR